MSHSETSVCKRVVCCIPASNRGEESVYNVDEEVVGVSSMNRAFLWVFYMQQLGLVLLPGLNYPRRWESVVSWVQNLFVPDLDFNFSDLTSVNILLATYLFVGVIFSQLHASTQLHDKRNRLRKCHSLQLLFFSDLLLIIGTVVYLASTMYGSIILLVGGSLFVTEILWRLRDHYMRSVSVPAGESLGLNPVEARKKYRDTEFSTLHFIWTVAIVPVSSIWITLGLLNSNALIAAVFGILGFIVVFFMILVNFLLARATMEDYFADLWYVGLKNFDVHREIVDRTVSGYRNEFFWLQVLIIMEKIAIIFAAALLSDDLVGSLPADALITLVLLCLGIAIIGVSLPHSSLSSNQADSLSRVSNIVLLCCGIYYTLYKVNEDNMDIIMLTVTGLTMLFWIYVFRSDVHKIYLAFVAFKNRRMFYQLWGDVDTLEKMDKILSNRKKPAIMADEWVLFDGNLRLLSLCYDRKTYPIVVGDDEVVDEECVVNSDGRSNITFFARYGLFIDFPIRVLNLSKSGIDGRRMGELKKSRVLDKLVLLRTLNLNNCKIGVDGGNLLLGALDAIADSKLEELHMSNTGMEASNCPLLASYIGKTKSIKSLDISCNKLEIGINQVFVEKVCNFEDTNLQNLNLRDTGVSHTNLKYINGLLKVVKNTFHFDLSKNDLSPKDIFEIIGTCAERISDNFLYIYLYEQKNITSSENLEVANELAYCCRHIELIKLGSINSWFPDFKGYEGKDLDFCNIIEEMFDQKDSAYFLSQFAWKCAIDGLPCMVWTGLVCLIEAANPFAVELMFREQRKGMTLVEYLMTARVSRRQEFFKFLSFYPVEDILMKNGLRIGDVINSLSINSEEV